MHVIANGDRIDLPEGATVHDLVHHLGLGEKWVVVERNGDAVLRSTMGTTTLCDGDTVEIVRAVAGG